MTTRGKWLDVYFHKNKTPILKSPAENNVSCCFQICVYIIEGKRLNFANPSQATSYVLVSLDDVKYRSSVRKNMRVPYYRENFVFELNASKSEMARKCLWFTVLEPCGTVPRLLGEAGVDLAHVWRQPHHTITHKWVQLSLPTDAKGEAVGYLKVDISISIRNEKSVPPDFRERIEDDLILPCGSEQQPACYQITIYRAYSVPCNTALRPDTLGNPPTTSLRVSFCNLHAETSPQCRSNNPVYVERVLMVEMFPNACDSIQLEVCFVNGGSKVLASTRLNLSEISHGGENGFLPTFGPTLLHMYQPWRRDSKEDGPFHRGALLVAMKTVVPDYRHQLRTVHVESVNPRLLDTEWIIDNFVMFCPILEVSMLDKGIAGTSCGVAITACEISFDSHCEQEQKKLHYSGSRCIRWYSHDLGKLELEQCPVLQLAVRLPDLRFRMYMDNVLVGIVSDLECKLSSISDRFSKGDYQHLNELLEELNRINDFVAVKIKKFIDIVQLSNCNEDMQKYTTELDHKLVQFQREKIEIIYCQLITRKTKSRNSPCNKCLLLEKRDTKKNFKFMLAESKHLLQELKGLVYKTPDVWPHISVWLLNYGSRVAYAKMAPSDIIHSVTPEQSGRLCGKIQTVYLKPIKCPKHDPSDCHCIAGKLELLAWMGSFRQCPAFQSCVPDGYRRSDTEFNIECDPMCLECCVNIYRAKLAGACDVAGLLPFVRIHFMSNVKDTQVCANSSFPVWSEVLRMSCRANVTPQRLQLSPPEILLEVYHMDFSLKDKIDLIGRVAVKPVFLSNRDTEPPALVWHDVLLGSDHVGKLQMSAQLKQISESDFNKMATIKTLDTRQTTSNEAVRTVLTMNTPEPLPVHMLPANKSYKIDVYFWGLREVSITKPLVTLELEDLTIKSAIISQCKCNANFPNGRVSQIFQGNLNDGSQLTIKLYDTTTFGRTLFAGSNVKRPQKYLLKWISRRERDEKLSSKPVVDNMFMQVNRNTFVKRNLTYPVFDNPETCESEKGDNNKLRWEKMKRMFYDKKVTDEEIMLLPLHSRENDSVVKETEDDWWARYHLSLNEQLCGDRELSGNRITLYDSELEQQPEFTSFKDWCRTIKIYNGPKTGIPDRDEKLRCGYLKANIAIYEWPAPQDTVAVCSSGDDLHRGYFENFPDNDPSRYLVRVYAVKCSGLVAKGFTTKSRCYVTVQCNSKSLCDRESSVPQDAEPLFGKMYELACTLPDDYLLKISVMVCGPTRDELIGSTSIDLDDRAFTKYRATVGLAAEYNINGPNRWRDIERPSDILEQLCARNHLPAPEYPNPSTLVVNGVEYKDLYKDSRTKYTSPLASKENLSLSILHKWHTMPVCGHRLVPEHVEIRTLYDPDKPGVEQGKIHMWVDMFPLDSRRIPAPVSISAQPDKHYELRVTVWDVRCLKLTKEASLYVRAWIGTCYEAQDTDVYVTNTGEGHFNWRMIFQFQYKATEKKVMLHDKVPFKEGTDLFPPILVVQLLDMDAPTLYDFLGILTLDLTAMPRGARLPQSAHAVTLSGLRKINMFDVRNARGWWPLKMIDRNTGKKYFAGMVELEISLLPQETAILMPVGIARDPPAALPDPIREQITSNKSGSPADCAITTRLVVVLSLLLLGCYLYWQLPVIVFNVLPSINM